MINILIYGMVFVGSALMVYNIYSYSRYLRDLLSSGSWQGSRQRLYFPQVLLVMFLIGYLLVGIFGHPDVIMSGILFFGSVYVTTMLGVLTDITKRVRESEKLESQLRTAEESNRAKTRFLSHMSHEIRTPMNAIIGLITIVLRDPELPKDDRGHLEKADASAQHLLGLINDILDVSRIESGNVELKNEPFLFQDLLDQVGGIILSQCEEKGLVYECREEGPVQESYAGDALKLKQVLINILGNSVKFTPKGGKITLGVQAQSIQPLGETGAREGGEGRRKQPVRFILQDNGEGMDEEYLPHIFDVFTQEDNSSTSRYGGSGLGMAITKSIVDLMDGEIRVESEKGRGTTFTVDVLLEVADAGDFAPGKAAEISGIADRITAEGTTAAAGAADEGAAERASEGAAGEENPAGTPDAAEAEALSEEVLLAGHHVLIVEDIELNAEILEDLLEMENVSTDWAGNGRIAVEKFTESEEYTYDAILMDLRMPEMDGLSATRVIRKLNRKDAKEIPIIALTANAFEEDIEQCLKAGMDAHVSKPVDSDILCAELRGLFGKRKQ